MNLGGLRHDWPVRWAHHPLCARHANETWRIGRMYLCRGCVSLASGVIGSAVVVLSAEGTWCLWALVALAPTVVPLSWPPLYRRLPRAVRDGRRLGAGLRFVLSLWVTWRFPAQAWPLLPLLFLIWRWFARSRRSIQARSCDGCPELGARGVCSGYALQAACIRSLEAQIEEDLGLPLAGSGELPIHFRSRR